MTLIETGIVGDDGQVIHPVLANTAKDGTGTWYILVVDAAGKLKVSHAVIPALFNVALPAANTEYSQVLPALTKKFSIGLRDAATFRLAFAVGKVAAPTEPYKTIPAGAEYSDDHVEPPTLTLFFASPVSGKTAEIIAWS